MDGGGGGALLFGTAEALSYRGVFDGVARQIGLQKGDKAPSCHLQGRRHCNDCGGENLGL